MVINEGAIVDYMYRFQALWYWYSNRYQVRSLLVPAIIVLVVIPIVATSIWILPGWLSNKANASSNSEINTSATSLIGSVSPLIFGSNLQLSTTSNQVLTSDATRNLLQSIHAHIVRIPLSSNVSDTTLQEAIQAVQKIGATPLVILHGVTDMHALDDDTHAIDIINTLLGQQTVYYEYDNEVDALGISAQQYTASWNAIIPHLKQLAPHGRFVGPVNAQYDSAYLTTFLEHARPLPDAISWHEYACDRSWSDKVCINNIAHWTTHITNARKVMESSIRKDLPIMITEWNYAADALDGDGKSNNAAFMTTWTTKAFQTLITNHIQASMQYASTDSATPLIDKDEKLTAQGIVFQREYEQLIPKVQVPTITGTSPSSHPGGTTATTLPALIPTAQPSPTSTDANLGSSSHPGGITTPTASPTSTNQPGSGPVPATPPVSAPIPKPTTPPVSAPTPKPTTPPAPAPTPKPPMPTPTPVPPSHGPLHYVDTYCTSDGKGVSTSGQWSTSSSGGYVGADSHGSCNGSFLWTLTASTVTHGATYFEYLPGGYNWNCTISVYIPTNHAGAPHATYWIHSQSLYLANITVDQETHSAWYRLQSFQFGTSLSNSSNYIFAQLRNNDSSTGWDLAIDAIKFDCSGSYSGA
jgi:hypothetical protein